MARIVELLRGLSSYPVPQAAIDTILFNRGIHPTEEVYIEGDQTKYNQARADLYMWLANAPDVSQGGQTYSFTNEQRAAFRRKAAMLYDSGSAKEQSNRKIFGYKGSSFR